MNMSKMDMINEGMEDWMEIQDIRAKMAKATDDEWNSLTKPWVIKQAKFRARNIGLSYWPALVEEWYAPDFDVKAYLRADEILSAQVGYKYGEVMPNGARSNGGWDSYGKYGISPSIVRDAWFAAGCKLGDKFDIQIRTGVVGKKYMSVRQTADYCRGFRWLKHRNMHWRFSTKAIVVIGRLSPEFRALATQNLPDNQNKIRIVDLNWNIVKAGQEFLARFDDQRDRLCVRAMLALTVINKEYEYYTETVGGMKLAAKILGYSEQLDALGEIRSFMERAEFMKLSYSSRTELMFNAILVTRRHVMYHPSVVELVSNSNCITKEDIAAFVMRHYGLDDVNNCRGLLELIIDLLRQDPMVELDCLRDYARAMALMVDAPAYGVVPRSSSIGVSKLFVDVYRLEPQMVHGFASCMCGMYVHMDTAQPMLEAMALYREGKIRKALTHACMPRYVIINRDFGFNLNASHDDQYEAINAKAINAVIKEFGQEVAARYSADTIRLTNALGLEAVAVIRAQRSEELVFTADVNLVHGIVNSYMPNVVLKPLPQQWNQFFRKHLAMLRYAGHVTPETPIPVSVEAFAREMAKHKYRRGLEASVELLELAARLEMSNNAFERYLDYIKRTPTKTAEMLPFVRIDGSEYAEIGSEYVLEKMHFDDISQLSIGEETACCQHLGGAGAASAKHSYEKASSATYILRKNGNVVAEAWVWRNDEDGVVIDSIEGRSSVPREVAAHAFYQMAVALIGKLCIKKVFISTTSYGLTRDVRRVIPHKDKMHQTQMIESCGYMDGRNHHLWVSAKMLKAESNDGSEE
jgi:hypothetical protein